MWRLRLLAGLLLATLAIAGCGADDSGRAPNSAAQLLLDAPPSAVHSGIYMAIERGYDDALGVNLRPRLPASPTDAVARLSSRGAEFAILDIHDLALARERGRDLVGVMAIVQTPLTAVFALPQIRTPRDLAGRRVALGGRRGDMAVLRSVVRGAGGDPAGVRTTPLGGAAVRNLLAGHVTAATGFWNVEGVALQQQRPQIREFRADDYGAPSYPELVLVTTRETLQDHPSLVRATVAALARGYEEVLSDPENGVSTLLDAVSGLDRARVQRELDAVSPSFTAGARGFGELNRPRLEAWARWSKRFGITKRVPQIALAFDGRYVPRPGRD